MHSLHTAVLRSRGLPVGSGSSPKKCHGLFRGAFGLLNSFSVPGRKSYFSVRKEHWEIKEFWELEEKEEVDIMPGSPAASGFDTVVTSLMTGMGLCDWLLSDQREVLLSSGRVTS